MWRFVRPVQPPLSNAVKKFSVKETNVRRWRNEILKAENLLKSRVNTLKTKQRGRPLLLGIDLDQKVKDYIRALRVSGGIVNRPIVIAIAHGILLDFKRALLPKHGGTLKITKAWANSLLRRMNLVKRKGTKAAQKLPEDFDSIMKDYFQRIKKVVQECGIPPELIINWDQTGVNMVPKSEWTLETEGAKLVHIVALEDKRQLTALLASTSSGCLLPPQLLYDGKTPACHPNFNFPLNWDIWHSESHWSMTLTMLRYVKNVIVPYVQQMRQMLLLPMDQVALVLFDVFKAHRSEELFDLLKSNNIKFLFVPASCTSELQPWMPKAA